MASVAQGVFTGGLPWGMVAIGAAIGVVIHRRTSVSKRRCECAAPVLAVAVGIYLPLELSVPIFAGGLIAASPSAGTRARGSACASAMRASAC